MKILIISGFLGAGKTTFIKKMIEKTKREYVIFENEFADVSVDGDIFKNTSNEENNLSNIFELSNGCVCCSTKGDFISSLLVIDNTLNPDILIVEPSGVAALSNIISNIENMNYDRIKLFPPISIIDSSTYFKYKEKYKDIFINQIKYTTHIQLSKLEFSSSLEIDNIVKDILTINPKAIIHSSDYSKNDISYWDNLFQGELSKQNTEIMSFNQNISNISIKNAKARDILAVLHFLEKLTKGYYGDIDRAKGVFKCIDYKIRFDVVNNKYEFFAFQGEEENNIVFIGIDFDKEKIKKDVSNLWR